MSRYRLLLIALLLALSFAFMKALPASTQGLVVYIQPVRTCTEWGPEDVCEGVLTVEWPMLDGAIDVVGCETLEIDYDATVYVSCQYEDPTNYYQYVGSAEVTRSATSADDAISSFGLGVDLLELNGALTPGQADSLRVKLDIAANHAEEGRFLPAGQLLAAFVYEGTSLVKGDTNPDFVPWGLALDLSEALKAVGSNS